jgi:hypothetical protein
MGSGRSGGKSGICLPPLDFWEKNRNSKEEEMHLTLKKN